MDRRSLLVEEHLDHGLRHNLGTASDSIDIVVAQVHSFIGEQLATPLDRDLVVRFAGWKNLVHRNALHKRTSVVVGVRARDVEGFAETSRSIARMRAFCRHRVGRWESRDRGHVR
jgi:hypothetical protein